MDGQQFTYLFQAQPPLEIQTGPQKQFVNYLVSLTLCVLMVIFTISWAHINSEPRHSAFILGMVATFIYLLMTAVWYHNAQYKLVLHADHFTINQMFSWNILLELRHLLLPKEHVFTWKECSEFSDTKSFADTSIIRFSSAQCVLAFVPPDYVNKEGYKGTITAGQIVQLMNLWRTHAIHN